MKMAGEAKTTKKVMKPKLFWPRSRSHKIINFLSFTIFGEAKALPKRALILKSEEVFPTHFFYF
jgi:hypothetical protein